MDTHGLSSFLVDYTIGVQQDEAGLRPLQYIEVRDQVEMGGHAFWPFSMNYTSFKKIFHSECNPRDT